jgi:hypothetical protein
VYASSREPAQGLAIRSGKLDILMFDSGDSKTGQKETPRHVWSFRPHELKEYEGDTQLGVGYRFALQWGADAPRGRSVTVIARYVPSRGEPIYSSPSTISLSAK